MMLRPLMVLGLTLPLMASKCDFDDAYAKACAGLTGAMAVFAEARAEAGPNTIKLVDVSFSQAEPFCKNPPADTTQAAVRITAASLVIWKAYRDTKS